MSKVKTEEKQVLVKIVKDLGIENTPKSLENLEIHFQENGSVDWKKMIPEEHFVLNLELFKNVNKSDLPPVSQVEDKQKLILLSGFRYIASIRGITSKTDHIAFANDYGCVCSCSISANGEKASFWAKLGEEEGNWSAVASANAKNTSNDMAFLYKESIAENRAFVRAVRGMLKISIVGKDEVVGGKIFDEQDSSSENINVGLLPSDNLQLIAREMGKDNFPDFKETILKCIEKGSFEDVSFKEFDVREIEKARDWNDLGKSTTFLLTGKIRKILDGRKK